MLLFDSNVVIYAADPAQPVIGRFVEDNPGAVSAVTKVEALGYHALIPDTRRFFESFFATAPVLSVTGDVIDRAIALRQTKKMSLGDALIAATALTTGRTLVTRNTKDFAWVAGLRLLDPLAGGPSTNGTHSPS